MFCLRVLFMSFSVYIRITLKKKMYPRAARTYTKFILDVIYTGTIAHLKHKSFIDKQNLNFYIRRNTMSMWLGFCVVGGSA